jgi:hypothetical protein
VLLRERLENDGIADLVGGGERLGGVRRPARGREVDACLGKELASCPIAPGLDGFEGP